MASNSSIALLRGVDLGGKNRLPMASRISIFEGAGCHRFRVSIQSGNVIFEAEPSLAGRIPEYVSQAISDPFGFQVPVVLRAADELAATAQANPHLGSGAEK